METPGKQTLNLSCSNSPDGVLDFVGNLARILRTSCSFSPDNVLDFKRTACSNSPDTVLDFSRCTQHFLYHLGELSMVSREIGHPESPWS